MVLNNLPSYSGEGMVPTANQNNNVHGPGVATKRAGEDKDSTAVY
jgi:hypothetical protein